MRLKTKLILTSSILIGLTASAVGAMALLVSQQITLSEMQSNLEQIKAEILSTPGDILSSALLAASNYDVSLGYIESDGSLSVLQSLAGDERDSMDLEVFIPLGENESLVIWKDTSLVKSQFEQSVTFLILIVLVFVFAGVFATNVVLRRDLNQIQNLIGDAVLIAEGKQVTVQVGRASSEVNNLSHALRMMLDKLTTLNKQTQDFMADASHELKTPLTVIRGYLELLLQSNLDDNQVKAVNRSLTESKRMQNLIGDMLKLSELGTIQERQSALTSLSDLINPFIIDLAELNPQRPIHIELDDGAQVVGDPELLKQLFSNIFSNLTKHTRERDSFQLMTKTTQNSVLIRAEDAGPGTDWIDSIGQKFEIERFSTRRNVSAEGSGLGLAIMKKIIEMHNGELRLFRSSLGGFGLEIHLPAHRA